MGALRLLPLLAAAIAATIAVLIAHGGSAPSIAPAAPVAVRASFDRSLVEFGDSVVARIVVTLDRAAVRPQSLQIADDLAPLTALSAPATTRTVSGRLETVTVTQRVACLTAPCLAPRISLPHVRVTVATRGASTATKSTSWRRLQVRGRVTAADLASSRPRLAADTAPGSPAYRLAPATAALVLEIVAALAAAAAATLVALEALRFVRRRRRAVAGDELARALALVREAEGRPAPDRRRALALLARLLRSRGVGLERAASDLAWSEPVPEPEAVDSLVTQVEQERAR